MQRWLSYKPLSVELWFRLKMPGGYFEFVLSSVWYKLLVSVFTATGCLIEGHSHM